MDLSESYIDAMEGAEECKTSEDYQTCEWKRDLPCDCAWNDFFVRAGDSACTEYAPGKSRALQIVYFDAQSQDTDYNGFRYSTSYQDVAFFPNETAWWDYIEALPKGLSSTTRYDNSYDKVQILTALSTILIPLYNYDRTNDKPLAAYIGYELQGRRHIWRIYISCFAMTFRLIVHSIFLTFTLSFHQSAKHSDHIGFVDKYKIYYGLIVSIY
jgi:hypothetical protein